MNQPMGDLPSDNGPNVSEKTPECAIDSEDVNIAPDIQKYLAQSLPKTNCCGLTLPVLFERIAPGKWWNPKFDSEVLEEQYKNSSFALTRLRFRFALIYTLIFSTSWLIYFVTSGARGLIVNWPFLCTLFGCVFLITTAMLVITHTKMYKRYVVKLSLVIAFALCILSLSLVALTTHSKDHIRNMDVGDSGHFIICIEILLIIYTVTPLPLYICITLGFVYSICFELLNMHLDTEAVHFKTILVRVVVHLCVHLISVHIFLMSLARMRGTFMHVGQSLLVRRQLEMEKQLKEKMIHSVMPPKLASWLMEETVVDSESNFKKHSTMLPRHSNPGASDFKSLFRPFNMYCMKNVSILFADIVGFTKMSSNKSAEELVNMLNDLFERFDELCQLHGCEKISTLGDCYYCVSGCPEPRSDHAKCCVEMGLGMIEAIQEFDVERGEDVNMRVGVHTGTVLCGIVGTRRFKFDVWSNDVSLANKLESTGQPGRVHISEETSKFLDGSYLLEEGEEVSGRKSYFIISRHTTPDTKHLNVSNLCNLKLVISPASTPCTSPMLLSSVSPKDSFATTTPSPDNLASVRTSPDISTNFLAPGPFRTKASSLPSILDTDVECEDKKCSFVLNPDALSSKSPNSTVSAGKYANKLKQWRVPKFLRKHSDTTPPMAILQKRSLNENPLQSSEIVNGYQQIPIVIESHENSKIDEDKIANDSFEKEIIDIRSYLSQSRSNMTPFGRSSSYRSQYGRIHRTDGHPAPRARSSTLTQADMANRLHERQLAIPAANPTGHGDDAISLCTSVYSRKDSGIRSTSRRSSIQHQIYAINQSVLATSTADLTHRVSGYYTSSQSSINDTVRSRTRLPAPLNRDCSEIQRLRKQSDLQLIRCVQDNTRSGVSYFVKPPLKPFTLFFNTTEMEREFRNNAHRNDEREATDPTITTSRFNTALDIFISAIIFALISISLFLVVNDYSVWLACFLLFAFLETTAIVLCAYRLYVRWRISETSSELHTSLRYSERIFVFFSDWYQWHICGGVLVSLPILSVLVNYSCILTSGKIVNQEQPLLVYLVCIGLVHYCNFTQMNWLVKNFLVLVNAIIFLILTGVVCPEDRFLNLNDNYFNRDNSTGIIDFSIARLHLNELYIDIFLLIILIWFLNRESEISYRLSYHRHILSNRDKAKVQNMRNQADWLLHNIIPRHVADQLKVTAKYSENHSNVGILFGSIINFNEMYDESYLMGKEYLRVLNELIADFDELLEKPEYSHVEKIKTIGSTFMAASGLNPKLRKRASDKNEHLYALMDFAMDMQKVIEVFNRDLIEFNLILRIGCSFGDVTAGVIGTTKLYYDIWGDAVNMASRMDSTGVANRIQVNEAALQALEAKYEFEPRGSVYVKGKDNMNVYLLIKKIE